MQELAHHLMLNASLVVAGPIRLVVEPAIEPTGRELRTQPNLDRSSSACARFEGMHQGTPNPLRARRREHGDPLRLGDRSSVELEQAHPGCAHIHAICSGEKMGTVQILAIDFNRFRDRLLHDEYCAPDGMTSRPSQVAARQNGHLNDRVAHSVS